VSDSELDPSPISEIMMECFAGPSGGATGVAAAAAPLMVLLRDDGSMLAYKVSTGKDGSSCNACKQLRTCGGLSAVLSRLLAHTALRCG